MFVVFAFAGLQANAADWKQYEITEQELAQKYGTKSDEFSMPEARSLMVELVNADRLRLRNLSSLGMNELADKVAQEHADEMSLNRYLGHYDLKGWKAPERWNNAGGTDMVIENVSYWEAEYDAYITPQMVKDVEARFIKSPGHLEAIMTPEATNMGFGLSIARYEGITVLTAVQLFVVDLGDFQQIPTRLRAGGVANISGRLRDGLKFFYAAVGKEPLPQVKTADYLNKHLSSYDTPQPFAGYLLKDSEGRSKLAKLSTYYTFDTAPGGVVQGQITVDDGQQGAGLYYIYLFARNEKGEVLLVMQQTVEAV